MAGMLARLPKRLLKRPVGSVPRRGRRGNRRRLALVRHPPGRPRTARMTVRRELINAGGLLSGVATYALVDYTMGSALWAQTTDDEAIATVNIAINYVQTAAEGDVVCPTSVDRRNRTSAVLRSEVRHDDGRLIATAIGSY